MHRYLVGTISECKLYCFRAHSVHIVGISGVRCEIYNYGQNVFIFHPLSVCSTLAKLKMSSTKETENLFLTWFIPLTFYIHVIAETRNYYILSVGVSNTN